MRVECFMRQSNAIEGEFDNTHLWVGPRPPCATRSGALNPRDIEAAEFALSLTEFDYDSLCKLHGILGAHRTDILVGAIRKCPVMVGSWTAPNPGSVRRLLFTLADDLPSLDSWQAHNRFEKIHPFEDLNGRVGRLLWLNKAVREGYNYSIPFLQAYYYQTLQHAEVRRGRL